MIRNLVAAAAALLSAPMLALAQAPAVTTAPVMSAASVGTV